MPLLLLVGFVAAMMWAKASDPFRLVEFSLKAASGKKVKGIAVLPKPVGKHPVVIYLHGAGGNLLGTGSELRQVAELGIAAVGLEYNQTNQSLFDEEFMALHQYLQRQAWAQSNATAWVGFSLGAQRTLSFALRHPELQPQLLIRRAGGWVEELNEQFKIQNSKTQDGEPAAHPSSFILHPSSPIRCPVLLIHGERDEVFPVADCKRLAERLRANGTPVEVRILPECGHVFGEDSGPVVRALAEYCAAKLPLTDYAGVVPGCRLTPTEARRFNLAMRRAGQQRRELWRAVTTSREPERHTVMNVIGGLEDYDLAHISAVQLEECVDLAWQARRKYPWCRDAPLEIFDKFVANPRIYEEPLGKPALPFVRGPAPRVKYCRDTGEASDAIGRWLYSRLRFRTAPAAPESAMADLIRQSGACREGAMMYTYLGRLAGLPMRPVYVIWPTLGSWHWYTEVWDTGEKQWHAVDSANQDRTYHTSWVLRVRKSTILPTTGERGGWNALDEQRWEAFTNSIGLFYPSGQVVVRVLDGEEPVKGQRVVTQAWLSNEVFSVLAARTDENGEARLTLGQTARHPYRLLIDRPGESDWQWLTVQSNQTYTVTLNMGDTKPFDKSTEPPAPEFSNKGETR
ncbi:MAG: prolyl oligopeptidase family serine peptidase [Verrucomicrobia subdivision 3 bacterium]|nr:prolyl oligopeptidase family serine peptidase [Limisphaerales bacterium]